MFSALSKAKTGSSGFRQNSRCEFESGALLARRVLARFCAANDQLPAKEFLVV